MSGVPLRPEQEQAAHRAPGKAVVRAGAGSGKTTVLTARFLHLVQAHRIPVRRIAALTFTEKAAAEMRERIAREIAGSDDPDVRAQAAHVEFAPISTIHAFGARLLREHAIEAGVDPAFELLDETDARLLLEDAWREVERRLRTAGDPRISVLLRLGGDDPAHGLRALYERLRGVDADLATLAWHRAGASTEEALVDLGRALEDLDAAVEERASSGKGMAPAALRNYREARARLPAPEALAGRFESIRRAAFIAVHKGGMGAHLPLPARVATEERKAVFPAYGAVAASLLQDLGERELHGPVRELLGELDRTYEKRKRDQGVLDFGDLELRCLRLFEGLARRGRRLEGAPRALLVDEYQDVNPVQAKLFEHLCAEGAPDSFSVGDPKQSIYRFRRADVRVLECAWDAAGESGRTKLTESFRSTTTIVEFHGALFGSLFAAGAAGVGHEPMRSMARFHEHEAVPPEFLLVDAGKGAGDARFDAEAAAVATRIRGWIDGGALRWKKEKGPDGVERSSPRPLTWRDVAVLLRARTHAKAYERAFVAAGIPFEVGRGKGFYDTEEIADLVHLLRVVHDPKDRFALAAFLTSPAVGATDEDLLAVFGDERGVNDAVWFRAKARKPAVCATIEELRRTSVAGSLEETVRAAIDAFDAVETSLLQPGGGRRARNLRKATAIARRLDAEGGHGLFDFLRRLTDLRDREVEESEAGTGGEGDAVSLLTIHAAKGLQWPCVVLAGTNAKEVQGGAGPSFLLAHDGRSFSAQSRDPLEGTSVKPSGYRHLAAEEDAAERQESLRLLYVALTRAEERLLITASVSGRTAEGEPHRLLGWGKAIWDVLGTSPEVGTRQVSVGGVSVVVRVEDAVPATSHAQGGSWFVHHGERALRTGEIAGVEEALPGAAAAWARVRTPVLHLGRTPFVVTISDLLAFARSPVDFYAERVVGAVEGMRRQEHPREPEEPASGGEAGPDLDAWEAARAERWDEGRDVVEGVDRAALGRAVHLALERWSPASGDLKRLVDDALAEEFQSGIPPEVPALALAMVARFLGSATGTAVRRALDDARDVRREVAFHGRIRFPKGVEVAGFDSLLVKGSIDLWVAGADGRVTVFDHKTNPPGARFPSPEALREHYETQLRLYALAAERVVGREVGGAALLLLDPGWAARGVAVECAVDVSGAALERTRDLCRAFAVAMAEERYPARWSDLL